MCMWMTTRCVLLQWRQREAMFSLWYPHIFSCVGPIFPLTCLVSPIRLYKLSPPNPMFNSKSSLSSFIGPTSGMTKVKSLCSVERAVCHPSNYIIYMAFCLWNWFYQEDEQWQQLQRLVWNPQNSLRQVQCCPYTNHTDRELAVSSW